MRDLDAVVRRGLPEWARYEGKATWAVSAYVYAAMLGAFGLWFWSLGAVLPAVAAGLAAVAGVLIGGYYRSAAKKRVQCSNCGVPVHGADECANCGKRTFVLEREV